jgi:ribose 5-phosphate isomerase
VHRQRQRDPRLLGGRGIPDPDVLDLELARIPGVAEHGLFVDLATLALLGAADGTVERLGKNW